MLDRLMHKLMQLTVCCVLRMIHLTTSFTFGQCRCQLTHPLRKPKLPPPMWWWWRHCGRRWCTSSWSILKSFRLPPTWWWRPFVLVLLAALPASGAAAAGRWADVDSGRISSGSSALEWRMFLDRTLMSRMSWPDFSAVVVADRLDLLDLLDGR